MRSSERWQELEQACGQALYLGARTAGAGSRQEIRAAVRRFLRRNRHDRGYLSRVLRAVLASSALAVSLLGLGAQPAAARATYFLPQTGGFNPIGSFDVGTYSMPALGDLDGDGDLDMVTGRSTTGLRYFRNVGSASSSSFAEQTGANNPFAAVGGSPSLAPALVDLDADGDLDLVVGDRLGRFRTFRNWGSATVPTFLELGFSANPLDGADVGSYATPAFGDVDGDGDLDLIAGSASGTFAYFQNTGSRTVPHFEERTGSANPLDAHDVGSFSAPALGVDDGDGDLDLISGEGSGAFHYFENTGSATGPKFAALTGAANPLDGRDADYASTPALGDLDADGDLDLVSGQYDGRFLFLKSSLRKFAKVTGPANPLRGFDLGEYSRAFPALGDLDADADLDLVAGDTYGLLHFFENTGSAMSPEFVENIGTANPLASVDLGYFATPALGDVDDDGDLDLVVGDLDGALRYFENTGSAAAPHFAERIGTANPFDGVDLLYYSSPTLGDLDGDGDPDLVANGQPYPLALVVDGYYFENTGNSTFVQRMGTADPLDGLVYAAAFWPAPALGDTDGDRDLDLVTGMAGFGGFFLYFENTGWPGMPAFVERTGTANPLEGVDVFSSVPALGDLDGDGDADLVSGTGAGGFNVIENALPRPLPNYHPLPPPLDPLAGVATFGTDSVPAQADLDGDGDLDLIAADFTGSIHYFENIGSATTPAYAERVGTDNPFNGIGGGFAASPALGDLDADGDIDLVTGDTYGFFYQYENNGDASNPSYIGQTSTLDPVFLGIRVSPTLGDIDGNGDLDLLAAGPMGEFYFFQNVGSPTSPNFIQVVGPGNPLDGEVGGYLAKPGLGDVDADGDLDLVTGTGSGGFRYFENIGNATNPDFVEQTHWLNPLDGEDAGTRSTAALGDLDGDGSLDLVSGDIDGGFTTYIPEPGRGWLLGVGLAGLTFLAHLRRRLRGRREIP